jgi:hypothetical protein
MRSSLVAGAAVAAAAAGSVALLAAESAQTQDRSITACQKARGANKGQLRIVAPTARCRRREVKLTWAVAGPPGPAGAAGAPGPVGDTGPKGDTGTPDTSSFYDKATSDARFLALAGKAADAELLDGREAAAFVEGPGAADGSAGDVDFGGSGDLDVGGLRTRVSCGTQLSVIQLANNTATPARWFEHESGASGELGGPDVAGIGSVGNGQTGRLLLQVAWGPGFTRVTTFTIAVQRGGGCPVRFWATAVTTG